MKSAVLALETLLLFPLLSAAQTGGLPPEWDIRKTLSALTDQTQRFKPILEQVKPQEWLPKSASEAYAGQLQSVRGEIGYLEGTVQEMSRQPDRLTLALEAFLRLQSVEAMMVSFIEGVRRHQNPAVANLLEEIMNENSDNSQKLRDYLVELATLKETEFKVADQEAQRCRSELVRQPPAASDAPSKGPRR